MDAERNPLYQKSQLWFARQETQVRVAVLVSLLLVMAVSPSTLANAQASLEKCTCRLDSTAAEDTSGSRAVNATLCVQQTDDKRHWCEVTIECLRGGIGPDCSGMQKDSGHLTKLFFQHIDELRLSPSIVAREMIEQSKSTWASLDNTLQNDATSYASCFNAFANKKAVSIEGKYGFRCSVNKEGAAIIQLEASPYTVLYYFYEQPK
jgi:hypothetical protein